MYQIEIRNGQFYPLEIRLSSQYGAQTRLIEREKQEKQVLSESEKSRKTQICETNRFIRFEVLFESKPLESII